MLLCFLYWIADGTTVLDVPVAADEAMVLSLPPISFSCPVGIRATDDTLPADEDDPDIEFLEDEELHDDRTEQA